MEKYPELIKVAANGRRSLTRAAKNYLALHGFTAKYLCRYNFGETPLSRWDIVDDENNACGDISSGMTWHDGSKQTTTSFVNAVTIAIRVRESQRKARRLREIHK